MIWCGIFIGFLLGSGTTLSVVSLTLKKEENKSRHIYLDEFERMADEEIIRRNK